jgi:hypothetical protein
VTATTAPGAGDLESDATLVEPPVCFLTREDGEVSCSFQPVWQDTLLYLQAIYRRGQLADLHAAPEEDAISPAFMQRGEVVCLRCIRLL